MVGSGRKKMPRQTREGRKVGSESPFFARWIRAWEKEVCITPKNKPWLGLRERKRHVRPEKEEKITPPWGCRNCCLSQNLPKTSCQPQDLPKKPEVTILFLIWSCGIMNSDEFILCAESSAKRWYNEFYRIHIRSSGGTSDAQKAAQKRWYNQSGGTFAVELCTR